MFGGQYVRGGRRFKLNGFYALPISRAGKSGPTSVVAALATLFNLDLLDFQGRSLYGDSPLKLKNSLLICRFWLVNSSTSSITVYADLQWNNVIEENYTSITISGTSSGELNIKVDSETFLGCDPPKTNYIRVNLHSSDEFEVDQYEVTLYPCGSYESRKLLEISEEYRDVQITIVADNLTDTAKGVYISPDYEELSGELDTSETHFPDRFYLEIGDVDPGLNTITTRLPHIPKYYLCGSDIAVYYLAILSEDVDVEDKAINFPSMIKVTEREWEVPK